MRGLRVTPRGWAVIGIVYIVLLILIVNALGLPSEAELMELSNQ